MESVHNILWELKDILGGPYLSSRQAACGLHATSDLTLRYTMENRRTILFQNGRKTFLSFCPLLYLSVFIFPILYFGISGRTKTARP
jgi:hypothetical protein